MTSIQLQLLLAGTVVRHIYSGEVGVVSDDQSRVSCLEWLYDRGGIINVKLQGKNIPMHVCTLVADCEAVA